MALFLVLWLVTQSSDVKSAIAGYFQDPLGRANEFGSSIIQGEGAQAANPRPIPQPQITDLRRDRLQVLGEQIRKALSQSVELGDIAQQIEIDLTERRASDQLLEDRAASSSRPAALTLVRSALLSWACSASTCPRCPTR